MPTRKFNVDKALASCVVCRACLTLTPEYSVRSRYQGKVASIDARVLVHKVAEEGNNHFFEATTVRRHG